MPRRNTNYPKIREIILTFLADQAEPVRLREICDHVEERATFISKAPRASIFSVLTRMPEMVRTEPGKYARSDTTREST